MAGDIWGAVKGRLVGPVRTLARPVLDRTPGVVVAHALPLARKLRGFQISPEAMRVVRRELHPGSTLLVFGVGRDSSTWEALNRRGSTAFLEDLEEWLDLALADNPDRDAYLIGYTTSLDTALDYTNVEEIPLPRVPDSISARRWDVVVVDGPRGFAPDQPGRASSVALAERLVKDGGLVLVDDYDRPVERHVCDVVFGRAPDAVIDPGRPVAMYRCTRR